MLRIVICVLFFLIGNIAFSQEIALTFDDAPTQNGPLFTGAERTKKIIQQLKSKGIERAAFFVITRNINELGIERIKQYSDAGHFLANHTHSHQRIDRLGTATYINDIRKADSVLKQMKGFKPWFRYPFLDEGRTESARDSIRGALKSMNLTNGYVTIDDYDWYLNSLLRQAIEKKQKTNDDVLRDIYIDHIWKSILFYDEVSKKVLGRSAKHVLLLHENDLAAKYIGDLIDFIRSKGWKIISPEEAYQDPISNAIPNVLFNGQGRIAAIAREKGIPARELVQESEDEEYLVKLVKERKVFE